MIPSLLTVISLSNAPVLASETQLKISGGLTGEAVLVNKIQSDGTKYVRLAMTLNGPDGRTVNVIQESVYDKNGRPMRKLQTTTLPGGSAKQSASATFDAEGARIKFDQAGKTVTEAIPWPRGKKVEATPEFWFIRDQPKPGDVTTYWRLDLGSQSFVETKCQYHGKRQITVGGKLVEAHFTTMGEAKAYTDNYGQPYLLEMNGARMERK